MRIRPWMVRSVFGIALGLFLPHALAADAGPPAWTGSMLNDRVTRLNPRTGEFVEYLLPRPTNIRRVFVETAPNKPVVFWVGSNHGAPIIKLEPLD